MIGQDAVQTAKQFDARIAITGVILTKLDGDARGGAALSIRATTGKPIKFFRRRRGPSTSSKNSDPRGSPAASWAWVDLVGLMKDFQEHVDEDKAVSDAEKMLGGNFTMDDFVAQIKTIQKMGSMKDLMDKMPLGQMFGGSVPDDVLEKATDDGELVKIEAIISSMTRVERTDPEVFLLEGARGRANRRLLP